MEAYSDFASVYDTFMDETPYEEWADFLHGLLKEDGIKEGLVLDLGCGTGSLTRIMAAKGYDMIGVDYSPQMLQIAMDKEEDSSILYLLQDMREFELYGTVAAVVSVCDCMNYITELEDLLEVFRLVNNYLDPGGIFIFDMNTEYKYRDVMGDCTIAEDREDSSFIWDNQYEPEAKINIYDLAIFVKEEEDLYRKYTETHYQRAYSLEEIQDTIRRSGMELLAVYDAFTKEPPREDSERIYVVARECGKQPKTSV